MNAHHSRFPLPGLQQKESVCRTVERPRADAPRRRMIGDVGLPKKQKQ